MKFIVLLAAIGMLASCASVQLNPEAMKVRITHNEPQNCEFLGDVTGSQGNAFTGAWTSNANMETGARNALKNKAYAMGGNTVYILTNRAGVTGSGSTNAYGAYSQRTQQTNVTLSGSVFRCN